MSSIFFSTSLTWSRKIQREWIDACVGVYYKPYYKTRLNKKMLSIEILSLSLNTANWQIDLHPT